MSVREYLSLLEDAGKHKKAEKYYNDCQRGWQAFVDNCRWVKGWMEGTAGFVYIK
jgi:hypothetical protein